MLEETFPACTFEKDQFSDLTNIKDSHELRQTVTVEIGNWRSLCENLKINRGTIETLMYSNDHPEYKMSDCLIAYFDRGEAVWEEVILAVAQPPLVKDDLARKIARRYLHKPNQAKILRMLQSCN